METIPEIAIVGCGVIGRKRATQLAGGQLIIACDLDAERAESVAAMVPRCRAVARIEDALASSASIFIIAN